MHPFVALMKKYCIDDTNSHDQSLYDGIAEVDGNEVSAIRAVTARLQTDGELTGAGARF